MIESIIRSHRLTFDKSETEDIPTIIEIERKKENNKFVYQWPKERHLESINNGDELHITIRDIEENEIIGYLIMAGFENFHNSLEFMRLVIDKKGYGYGKESIELIKKMSFEEYGCHRLWLDVYDDNKRAIHIYKSMGFVEEGTLRECKKSSDGYRSMIIMSILDREYKKQ
ncbi:GNAT family N-acetyltransferase [Clostridiisalibacter paucivorans]|uniref:GNAT family N-acetyltransferase n=1 Tax=Clostridiisalibacter paucivorans TaxID=408753 RepID=UPI000687708E|nr:GNAT family protein [Clostridiisalibacter paucivorans]